MDVEYKELYSNAVDLSTQREPTVEEALSILKDLAQHVLQQGPLTRLIVYGLRSVGPDSNGALDADIFVSKAPGHRDGEIASLISRDQVRLSVWRGRPYYLLVYWPSGAPDRPIDGAVLGQQGSENHFMFPDSWQRLENAGKAEDWGFFRQDFSGWPLPNEEEKLGCRSITVKDAIGTFFGAYPAEGDDSDVKKGFIEANPDSVGAALLKMNPEALPPTQQMVFGVLHKDRLIFAERSGFYLQGVNEVEQPADPSDPFGDNAIIGPPLSPIDVAMLQPEFIFIVQAAWFQIMPDRESMLKLSEALAKNPVVATGDAPVVNGNTLVEGLAISVQKPGERGRTPTQVIGHILSVKRQDGSYEPWRAVKAVAMHVMMEPVQGNWEA